MRRRLKMIKFLDAPRQRRYVASFFFKKESVKIPITSY